MQLDRHPVWFHILAPILTGSAFGLITMIREPHLVHALTFARPIVGALVIWAVMVPTTFIVNNALRPYGISLLIRLLLAAVAGALPISLFEPWILVNLKLGGPVKDMTWMTVAAYDNHLLTRFAKFVGLTSVIWVGVTYRFYATQEQKRSAPAAVFAGLPPDIQRAPTPTAKDILTAAPPDLDAPVLAPQPAEALDHPPPPPPKPAFMERVDKPLGDIWAVSAEQHYIRIIGSEGEDLILYRFGDAVRDLAPLEGIQVHRSHWVADQAVEGLIPIPKAYQIKLKNGTQIPVSRSYKVKVEERGWPTLEKP